MKKLCLLFVLLFAMPVAFADPSLYCAFDDSLVCADGEIPLLSTGVSFEEGLFGSGVRIDTGDVLSYATLGNFDKTVGTVMMWVKTDWSGGDGSEIRYFFSYVDNGYSTDALRIRKGDGPSSPDWAGIAYYESGGPDRGSIYYLDETIWQADTWYHIAATWDASVGMMKFYIDGVVVESRAVKLGTPMSLDPMTDEILIGTTYMYSFHDYPERRLQGVMDELYVYEYVLTDEEIFEAAQPVSDEDGDGVSDEEDFCSGTVGEALSRGCSCEQILDYKPGKNKGELKHGCSQGTIDIFTTLSGWAHRLFG